MNFPTASVFWSVASRKKLTVIRKLSCYLISERTAPCGRIKVTMVCSSRETEVGIRIVHANVFPP